jgi:hypothetical protein
MIRNRARLLGAVLTAAAVAVTVVYAQAALAGGGPSTLTIAVTEQPTPTPPVPPSATPTPTPTPSPTASGGSCSVPTTPTPTTTGFPGLAALAGPVTCDDGESVIKVSWDGTNLTIVIAAATTKEGKCELDPKSVKVTEPKGATVDKDGVVTLPYDKDKKVKITIKIDYDLKCTLGGDNFVRPYTATIEFTPPDGPISIGSKPR